MFSGIRRAWDAVGLIYGMALPIKAVPHWCLGSVQVRDDNRHQVSHIRTSLDLWRKETFTAFLHEVGHTLHPFGMIRGNVTLTDHLFAPEMVADMRLLEEFSAWDWVIQSGYDYDKEVMFLALGSYVNFHNNDLQRWEVVDDVAEMYPHVWEALLEGEEIHHNNPSINMKKEIENARKYQLVRNPNP